MILAETCPSCSYLITWFVGLLLKITLKGLLVDWKCLWSMFVIWFLNITRKSRNFHAFTQAYLAHAQTNFPAATIYYFVALLKMKPWGSFQVNEVTNVVFMILGGCFISEIVLNLSFRRLKNTCKIRLHVYTSLRAGVARSGLPIKTRNDKFSLLRKRRLSNQRPWTMIFHRVKFHRSWCRLAIVNSERLLRTSISVNKSLYSYNKSIIYSHQYTKCCSFPHSSEDPHFTVKKYGRV